MLQFWLSIITSAWHIFDPLIRRVWFWITTAFLLSTYVLGLYWFNWLRSYWWVVPLLVAIYAVTSALEQRDDAHKTLATTHENEILELRRQLHQRDATAATGARRAAIASALQEIQTRGIALNNEITRTFIHDQHQPQLSQWLNSVETYLEQNAADYLNEMRLPIPVNPKPRIDERQRVLWELAERLRRLQLFIQRLRQ